MRVPTQGESVKVAAADYDQVRYLACRDVFDFAIEKRVVSAALSGLLPVRAPSAVRHRARESTASYRQPQQQRPITTTKIHLTALAPGLTSSRSASSHADKSVRFPQAASNEAIALRQSASTPILSLQPHSKVDAARSTGGRLTTPRVRSGSLDHLFVGGEPLVGGCPCRRGLPGCGDQCVGEPHSPNTARP